jgi:hypothetical protein
VGGRSPSRADPPPRAQTALANRQHPHAVGDGRIGEWSRWTCENAVLECRDDVEQDPLGTPGGRGEGDDQANRATPGVIGMYSFDNLRWINGALMLTLAVVKHMSRDDGGFSGMGAR